MNTPDQQPPRHSDSWCVLPWIHLSSTVDGVWGRCCFDATNDYDHYYQQDTEPDFLLTQDALGCLPESRYADANPDSAGGIRDAFNSRNMRRTRLQMLAGERPTACRHCFEREDRGLTSHRHAMNATFADTIDVGKIVERTAADGRLEAFPLYLDLRFGNTCNLACVMCAFPISSRHGAPGKPSWSRATIDPYATDEDLWAELTDHAHQIRYIYFAGGEPFMQNGHYRLIDTLVRCGAASNIELHYNSNLTVLPRNGFDQLRQFKKVDIAASCDGVGEIFETIRVGGTWDTFVANLRQARRHVDVWLDVTVQKDNIAHLSELIAFAREEKLRIRLENFVDFPSELSVRNLPDMDKRQHSKDLRNLATNCEEETATQLLRLIDYLNAQ